MDADRFDTIARSLTESPSRRTVLSVGLGGLLAALLGSDQAAAKKKGKGKGKKGKGKGGNGSPPPPPSCPGPCAPDQKCVNGACCGDDFAACDPNSDNCCPGLTCVFDFLAGGYSCM